MAQKRFIVQNFNYNKLKISVASVSFTHVETYDKSPKGLIPVFISPYYNKRKKNMNEIYKVTKPNLIIKITWITMSAHCPLWSWNLNIDYVVQRSCFSWILFGNAFYSKNFINVHFIAEQWKKKLYHVWFSVLLVSSFMFLTQWPYFYLHLPFDFLLSFTLLIFISTDFFLLHIIHTPSVHVSIKIPFPSAALQNFLMSFHHLNSIMYGVKKNE